MQWNHLTTDGEGFNRRHHGLWTSIYYSVESGSFSKIYINGSFAKLPKNIIPQWHQRKHGWSRIWSWFHGFWWIFIDGYNRCSHYVLIYKISGNEHFVSVFRKHNWYLHTGGRIADLRFVRCLGFWYIDVFPASTKGRHLYYMTASTQPPPI